MTTKELREKIKIWRNSVTALSKTNFKKALVVRKKELANLEAKIYECEECKKCNKIETCKADKVICAFIWNN